MTKYKKVTPEIAAQLQAIVGAKRFFAGDAVKDDFSHDEMPIYGKYYPEVVCEAESTEEVSAILRVCYENDIPVTPRGAGTGLVGGCVPLRKPSSTARSSEMSLRSTTGNRRQMWRRTRLCRITTG